jgi:DICT domain-containing protein
MLHSSPGARPTADAARKFYGKWTVGRWYRNPAFWGRLVGNGRMGD